MKNIFENLIAGLIVAFIAGFLPWLSIRRFEIYQKLSPVLSRIAFELALISLCYDIGLYVAYFTIADKYVKTIQITMADIDNLLIPLTIIASLYFGFIIYLTVLDNIDKIMHKTNKNSENNPRN